MLSEAIRAEKAFEKAFNANPRSTLSAKRLARIKRSKGAYSDAQRVLHKCLDYNPAAQDLHYDLAMTYLESAQNADQTNSDAILYHLRRSFSPGDRNLQAQFWYARQLCIAGHTEEAIQLFKTLGEARVPFKEKTIVRGIVKRDDGTPREFVGTIIVSKGTFGFLQCDEMNLRIFSQSKRKRTQIYLSICSRVPLCASNWALHCGGQLL